MVKRIASGSGFAPLLLSLLFFFSFGSGSLYHLFYAVPTIVLVFTNNGNLRRVIRKCK